MPRIVVFLDGANHYFTERKMGWKIDFKKLLSFCKKHGDIFHAIYYNARANDKKQIPFHKKLENFGYMLKTKPIKTISF